MALLALPRELINRQLRFFSNNSPPLLPLTQSLLPMTQLLPPLGSGKREQLAAHFKVPLNEYTNRWESLWQQGDLLLWDKGKPSPALVDLLTKRRDLVGPSVVEGKRKRALVPGCGRGYDVLLLAGCGYDAYGLDVSETAVNACEEFGEREFKNYTTHGSDWGCGQYKFVNGDFFKDDWREGLEAPEEGFDLIYDYTFFCALPPDMRPDWALRMFRLLSPTGKLICLEFPTWKDPVSAGPPWGLRPEFYVAHLSRPGVHLPYDKQGYLQKDELGEEPDLESAKTSRRLERVERIRAEKTHDYGVEGNVDWISVWQHC